MINSIIIDNDNYADLDRTRYLEIAYDALEDLTSKETNFNPYIEDLIETLKGVM